jgi:hypothetical protein
MEYLWVSYSSQEQVANAEAVALQECDCEEDPGDQDDCQPRGHGVAEYIDCWVEDGIVHRGANVGNLVTDCDEEGGNADHINREDGDCGEGEGGTSGIVHFIDHVCCLRSLAS